MKRAILTLSILLAGLIFSLTPVANAVANDPGLQAKINQVWGNTNYASWMNSYSVTWNYGYVPDGKGGYYGGYFQPHCFFIWCVYDVTILPNYSGELDMIAHEGAHTICFNSWYDNSEACADAVAKGQYPAYQSGGNSN